MNVETDQTSRGSHHWIPRNASDPCRLVLLEHLSGIRLYVNLYRLFLILLGAFMTPATGGDASDLRDDNFRNSLAVNTEG